MEFYLSFISFFRDTQTELDNQILTLNVLTCFAGRSNGILFVPELPFPIYHHRQSKKVKTSKQMSHLVQTTWKKHINPIAKVNRKI